MSDFENHDIAKQRAQQRAEHDAQKKAGVALKTFSWSINSELTDEEVSAVTNNIFGIIYQQLGEKVKSQTDFSKAKKLGWKG